MGLIASAASAETARRCAILGQMAVSSWLEMVGALGNPKTETLDPILARLSDLSSAYAGLAPPLPAIWPVPACLRPG
ncbi:hypothetical protein [Poseidonocella pacifica]|uniref:hypothetical protein n=1 Tax=Poseidonocella pacifica TaxID=871651 RepID=UPI000B89D52C|nr:hypothetical protein [Poseidonocella pacifica]